jgi:hypothetical protein
MKKDSLGFLSRLKNLIVPDHKTSPSGEVTNTRILNELMECFADSLNKESVGSSLLFNTHYIIILHPDTYEARLTSFPVIVKETVKSFYNKLSQLKKQYEDVSPISSKWNFKFGPGAEFNNEKIEAGDIKVIGMLTGEKEAAAQSKAKVTLKPKKSNVYDKMDINLDAFQNIDFRESGTFAVKFNPALRIGGDEQPKSMGAGLARIDYFVADKNVEESYTMKDKEIVVARKDPENENYSNYLLIDSLYVSNPHARIRYNDSIRKFQIASFSRNETRINERVIPKSELSSPQWYDLPDNSQILLNGLVTLKFQSNR